MSYERDQMSDHARAARSPSVLVAVFVTLLTAIVVGPGSTAPASAGAGTRGCTGGS
jgi:hypothetical protein